MARICFETFNSSGFYVVLLCPIQPTTTTATHHYNARASSPVAVVHAGMAGVCCMCACRHGPWCACVRACVRAQAAAAARPQVVSAVLALFSNVGAQHFSQRMTGLVLDSGAGVAPWALAIGKYASA